MKNTADALKGGLFLLACALGASEVRAQVTDLQDSRLERAMHQDLVAAVAQGRVAAPAALALLNGKAGGGGQATAEAGYAALDVALRLQVARRPAEAQVFFEAAEAILQQVVNQLPDSRAEEKSGHLQNLARMRGQYLSKTIQAKADLEQALRLRPADKRVLDLQRQLAVGRGDRATVQQLAQRAKEVSK